MLLAGIILLIVGFAIAYLADDPRFEKLGYLVAVVGVVVIVIAVIVGLGDEEELDAAVFGPLGLLARLRTPIGSRS